LLMTFEGRFMTALTVDTNVLVDVLIPNPDEVGFGRKILLWLFVFLY
jgi:hypothetical protein